MLSKICKTYKFFLMQQFCFKTNNFKYKNIPIKKPKENIYLKFLFSRIRIKK